MKKFRFLALALIAAVFTFAFTACSSDDEDTTYIVSYVAYGSGNTLTSYSQVIQETLDNDNYTHVLSSSKSPMDAKVKAACDEFDANLRASGRKLTGSVTINKIVQVLGGDGEERSVIATYTYSDN